MNEQWIDILPLTPPSEEVSAWIWLFLISLLLVCLVTVYLWRNSNRQKSLRTLKYLQHDLSISKNVERIPFQLSNAIKSCFEVKNINHISMNEEDAWNKYKHRLETECFSKKKSQQTELEKLISEARYWIKQQVEKNG